MGAEIQWLDGPHGVIRFGPDFHSSKDEDDYTGSGYAKPDEEDPTTVCVIGPLSGEMSRRDHDDILAACAEKGFLRAKVRRHKRWHCYDLTARPFRRVRSEKPDLAPTDAPATI